MNSGEFDLEPALTELKSATNTCMQLYSCILTKLHFADFDPCTVVRYLATRTDKPYHCMSFCITYIGTALLANILVFIYMCEFIL